VTGTFTATPKQINCNDKVNLAWNTTETLHTAITSGEENFPELPMAGRETVSPKHTTTYNFKTSGPGGIIESAEAVEVNPVVKADLSSSPEDVHYLRIGDKVITQDHATLTWNVANADNVTLEPFGQVSAAGTNTVSPAPNDNATGAINETRSYKLEASNVCGGSDMKTVNVHLVGNVEPAIASLFFPTGYPDKRHPAKGLVKSQQQRLATIATVFKLYMEHEPDAKLQLVGYADPRGHRKANQKLSARRAMIVKDFLVAQGIPSDRIILQIKGAKTPLDRNTVKMLEAQNPEPAPPARAKRARATRLAYDRRVDLEIQPIATESVKFFPHHADDSALLFNPRWLGQSKIHRASE
jgi:outer membrane protein OmpA-like peptidoglycan-associated protein